MQFLRRDPGDCALGDELISELAAVDRSVDECLADLYGRRGGRRRHCSERRACNLQGFGEALRFACSAFCGVSCVLGRLCPCLCLLLIVAHCGLGSGDLALQRHELLGVLVNPAVLQGGLGLPEFLQLFLALPDRVVQELLFLPEQFDVLRVQFEEPVDVIQL